MWDGDLPAPCQSPFRTHKREQFDQFEKGICPISKGNLPNFKGKCHKWELSDSGLRKSFEQLSHNSQTLQRLSEEPARWERWGCYWQTVQRQRQTLIAITLQLLLEKVFVKKSRIVYSHDFSPTICFARSFRSNESVRVKISFQIGANYFTMSIWLIPIAINLSESATNCENWKRKSNG